MASALAANDATPSRPAPARIAPSAADTEEHLLATFHRAAREIPAYRTLLREQGVRPDQITDVASFSRCCPVLTKANTFDRFPIDQLSVVGQSSDIADVLTSSGNGGRFSFGLSTRAQAAATARFLDDAFDAAFGVKSRTTLAINCLPMGVGFSSQVMTLATTSVREDMAVALVKAFGGGYEQVLLVGDPLFLKRLTDHAADLGFDWTRHRMNVIVGEEIFGEHYRTYLASLFGTDEQDPDRGYIMSSFGVGELGLHLGYETRATIAVRRAAHVDPAFAREIFRVNPSVGDPLPMLFGFDPERMFLEVIESDAAGFGLLVISMLDAERRVPMLRYHAGDVASLLDRDRVTQLAARHGVELPGPLPAAMFALRGRKAETLPNGSHVGVYKDALYREPTVARAVTGAFRLGFDETGCAMHVQLLPGTNPSPAVEQQIQHSMRAVGCPADVILWPYNQFPFGMTLDYERKFAYYVARPR